MSWALEHFAEPSPCSAGALLCAHVRAVAARTPCPYLRGARRVCDWSDTCARRTPRLMRAARARPRGRVGLPPPAGAHARSGK